MIYGLWQSAAGLQAQEYRQAIIANNLANAETPGFKADRVAFQERLNAAVTGGDLRVSHPVLDAMTGGLYETPVYTDFAQGSLVPSNNDLDVGLDGEGFLVVQTPDGARYTRDGRMMMNAGGMLVHAVSGAAVLDGEGQPIFLDPSIKGRINIDESGRISQGRIPAGRLGMVDFPDTRKLEKVGQDLFAADGIRPVEARPAVKQNAYEASGVEPITALVEMIAAGRAYESNARMISLQDESLGRMVSELGRIG